jgi:hypothetical protein
MLTLYASPNGSGTECTQTTPCALLQARQRVRERLASLRSAGQRMSGHIHVVLFGGTYRLGSTLELTTADSSLYTSATPYAVIYQAADPANPPVLSGGVAITGWSVDPRNARLYRARVPSGFQETRQLYVNDQPAQRTRSALYPAGFTKTSSGFAGAGSMAGWRNLNKMEVVQTLEWRHLRCPVASISGSNLNIAQPCWNHAQTPVAGLTIGSLSTQQSYPFQTSWIENAYEFFSGPGQWYHDVAEGYLYYWPRAGESLTGADAVEVIAPQLETLMRVAGTPDNPVQHLQFRGLTFAHATWRLPSTASGYVSGQAGYIPTPWAAWAATPGNVVFDYAQGMLLLRNTFKHLGATALTFEHGAKWNQIHGNRFTDISGAAVRLADIDGNTSDERRTVRNNWIVNNYIARAGREYFDHPGITVVYAADTIVDRNELYDLPYSGISLGWGWTSARSILANNQVTRNRIQNVMQHARDGGMIYTLSNQPNSTISGNHLVSQPLNYGALYLDQGSLNFTIHNNVIGSSPNWLVLHQSDSTVQTNYADVFGNWLWPANAGKPLTRNSRANQWPAQALTLMEAAGLDASMRDMREPRMRIEAESFNLGGQGVAYNDTTAANEGSYYRLDIAPPRYQGPLRYEGVDIYTCSSCSNLHTVGGIASGEWLTYSVYVNETGTHDVEFVVGGPLAGGQIQLHVDGQPVGAPVNVPVTGSWSAYETVKLPGVALTRGSRLVTLAFTGAFNLDYFVVGPRR